MDNGLYKVAFKTPLGEGFGVVTLENGRLGGGDASMFYAGTYTQEADNFVAEVKIGTHTHIAGVQSVLGVAQGQIKLEGKSKGNAGTMTGSSPQAPGVPFTATLSKISF